MHNISGFSPEQTDHVVKRELDRARLPVQTGGIQPGEIKTRYTSDYKGFHFHRAWSYWVVTGPMPLSHAIELHQDPIGRDDIRIAGHCGCPAPEAPWVKWLTPEGKEVISTSEWKKGLDLEKSPVLGSIVSEMKENCVANDDPASIAKGYVMMYHIDSEAGLRIFVDKINSMKQTMTILKPDVQL